MYLSKRALIHIHSWFHDLITLWEVVIMMGTKGNGSKIKVLVWIMH